MNRILLGLVSCILPLTAQTSAIQGVVTDQQGAAIPEAVVSVTNDETSASRKAITTAVGSYSFAQLPPGAYTVAVQAPGFRTQNQKLRLQVNTPAALDIRLEIGQVTE